ncbi:(2Fe-2S)-binding protein [Marinobacterium lutimaris]|uniref:2Fe-2S iron-sulfur cluster binding domain-containing protein n=1 Tax=Marinobacterium lutimaris TaxID=568106 RepID=A0A1H5TQ76_9GAMM|nr:(2Fe-2S)-binding protein [Marinobacterium lutimaris]SEF64946.1 2Fe-2S iron-sulfur cluster binding domain-containing protein [Marinobacterium lutimaris]
MFRDISNAPQSKLVTLLLDGESIEVPEGFTVAAAMLLQQRRQSRTSPVSGVPRGPFCLMGACFECLVEIDGINNQQACMLEVRQGMHVRTQLGPGELTTAQEELFHEV